MKNIFAMFFVGFILVFTNNVHAQMSKSDLQKMYVSYLKEQGYQPSIDSDGDVTFKAEGRFLYIDIYEDDLEYFSIVYPNFWEIESEEERQQVALVASYVTRTTKVARVYMTSRDDTCIAASILILKPEDFKMYFNRMVDIILLARRKFMEEMYK